MKSVQLEHGHVRIANPIMEALALAPFTGAQFRVIMHLIRETYGWRRKDAEVSLTALCAGTSLSRSSASDALTSLVAADVVIQVQPPGFRTAGVYRVQKDPREWSGQFQCNPPSLAPESTATPDSTGRPDSTATPCRTVPADRTQSTATPDSSVPELVAPQQLPEPERQVQIKTEKDRSTTTTSREELASHLVMTANQGMAANPRIAETFRPIDPMHGSRSEVIEWLDAGVPAELAETVVRSTAETYRPSQRNRQINTMRYFTSRVLEEYERRSAQEHTNGHSNGKRRRDPAPARGAASPSRAGKDGRRRRSHRDS